MLVIGEININSETLSALAKGLETAGEQYFSNLGLRTIPLSKNFADMLRDLAARCSWMVQAFDTPFLSSALCEYGIDIDQAKALLCQIQQAANYTELG